MDEGGIITVHILSITSKQNPIYKKKYTLPLVIMYIKIREVSLAVVTVVITAIVFQLLFLFLC